MELTASSLMAWWGGLAPTPNRSKTSATGQSLRDLTPNGPLQKHYFGTLVVEPRVKWARQIGHRRRRAWARSSSSRRRMAGRLGCGGPPAVLFPPLGGLQAQMLQEQIRDQRHQAMPVQTPPRAALEVIKPELFLKLLVRLLAHPARLDERGQPPQLCVGRQVREIVLALARGAVLAHEQDLIAGQMLTGPTLQTYLRPVCHPHPHGGELCLQRPLGAAPPADPAPRGLGQHGLG